METPRWPTSVEATLERLLSTGVPLYVVGGALRDLLLGRAIRDIDLVAEGDLATLARSAPGAVQIAAHTPVLAFPADGERPRMEITVLRAGARTLVDDLALRDFTLNAIAFDPRGRRWVDPWHGRGDLRTRRLRAVHPGRVFRDDPIRVLRGVRLALDLDLTEEADTRSAMERDAFRLRLAPGERIREELFRLLELPRPSLGLEHLRRVGALAAVLPELGRGVGVAQNRQHPDDVYRHSLRTCDQAAARPVLRLAALLHDVAKPETKSWAPRRADFSFHRHEIRGRPHLERVGERLRLSRRDQSRLERLVRHHLVFPERLARPAALRRMLRRVGRDILEDLLELRRADLASREPHGEAPPDWQALVARIRATPAPQPARPVIGGRDIMSELGVPPGPLVGRWLRRVERYILEHPDANDRARLLTWLREAHVREGD